MMGSSSRRRPLRSIAAAMLILAVTASLANAAATYRASAAGGDTVGTTNRFAAITPAVGDLLVVFCAVAVNTLDTPTCSDNNGGAYALIGVAQFGANNGRLSLFVRTTLVPNTTSTTVTVATGSNQAGEIVVFAIAGMTKTGAAAIRSSGKQENQPGSSVPAPVLNQAALTSNVTLGAVTYNVIAPALTEPTGWTERQDAGQITPTVSLEAVSRDSGFTGTTVTWGSATTSHGSWIIELDGSASATTLFRNRSGSRSRFGSG